MPCMLLTSRKEIIWEKFARHNRRIRIRTTEWSDRAPEGGLLCPSQPTFLKSAFTLVKSCFELTYLLQFKLHRCTMEFGYERTALDTFKETGAQRLRQSHPSMAYPPAAETSLTRAEVESLCLTLGSLFCFPSSYFPLVYFQDPNSQLSYFSNWTWYKSSSYST